MMTTTPNSSEVESKAETGPAVEIETPMDMSFELETAMSFEDFPEDDKSYAGAQALPQIEKQKEILAHLDAIREEIQLTLIPEVGGEAQPVAVPSPVQIVEQKPMNKIELANVDAKNDLSLPAVLCDEELLLEIAQIPDRLAFKIGDVADMLGIKQYVLRYWESEFELLKPKKASNNQRMYAKKDVENAYLIRKLLHRDRFSIEGARQALRALKNHVRKEKNEVQAQAKMSHKILNMSERLEHLVLDLRKLKDSFLT